MGRDRERNEIESEKIEFSHLILFALNERKKATDACKSVNFSFFSFFSFFLSFFIPWGHHPQGGHGVPFFGEHCVLHFTSYLYV